MRDVFAGLAGSSMARVGGVERVTGQQKYAADIRLEGQGYVKLVYAQCARARVVAIDTSEALASSGVLCVVSASDLPQPVPRFGPMLADRPLLAVGETKFLGEPVLAVVAETEDEAEWAASRARISWEELPPVLTAEEALDPAAPLVQDPGLRHGQPLAATNILNEWRFGWGDVEQAGADCVIENDYSFPLVTHFAIEPHAYLARPDADGVTLWSPTQHPYVLQRVVAQALGWPFSRIRVIAPDPGGAFGGKGWPKFEPLLAWLALRTGRPVRLVLTLEETFMAVRRSAAKIHIRTGFGRSGQIRFQDIETDFLIGAYADVGPRIVSKGSYTACGPYRTPHARIRARAILSHTTPATAFRGFGAPQAAWALESQMDEAARILELDRVEIRRRNLPVHGEAFIPNDTACDGDWRSALDQAAAAIEWGRPLLPHHGRGISFGLKSSATASVSFALARLHGDGSVTLATGTSDMGQGARTVFTQLVADELGVAPDRIRIVMGDTAVVPFDSSTSASRSTVFMGNAILKACRGVRTQLAQLAAERFEVPVEDVRVIPGVVIVAGTEYSLPDLLKLCHGRSQGEVVSVDSVHSLFDASHPLGGHPAFWETMCIAVEVEVDPETGMIRIPKLVLVSDVGKALNPMQVETQDEGSAVMGLGHTLMEHLILDEHGRILNLGALDYRIPSIEDIPVETRSILIENRDGPGPFGAKGAGEGGTLSIAAAVASAVREACGAAIRDLPLTPEKVWRAMNPPLPGAADSGGREGVGEKWLTGTK